MENQCSCQNQIPSEVKECEENKNKLNGNVVKLRGDITMYTFD